MTKVYTSKSCASCIFWMPVKERCRDERTADKHRGRRYCNHWQQSPKWQIMQERTQEQVNLSRWNSSHIEHRRLEVL